MKHIIIAFVVLGSVAIAQAQSRDMKAPFADVPANHWAADAIARLVEAGIIIGYPAKETRTVSSAPQKIGKTSRTGVKKYAGKTR